MNQVDLHITGFVIYGDGDDLGMVKGVDGRSWACNRSLWETVS